MLRRDRRSPRALFAGAYSGHGVAASLRMGALIADRLAESLKT